MSVFSSGLKRRARRDVVLCRNAGLSRLPAAGMKQKFYSQVNMERIFFFFERGLLWRDEAARQRRNA
jgi:hypothetical protein